MIVEFDPTSQLVPGILTQFTTGSSLGPVSPDRKVLIISTMLTGAGGTTGEVVRTYSPADGEAWGKGGPIDAMVRAVYRMAASAKVYVLALAEDAAGTKAKVDVTFAGTATEAGTAELLIAGQLVRFAVASGDAAAAVASAASAAINKVASLPVVGSVASAVATATAKWKGLSGSYIGVEVLNLPAGLTATPAATAGTADPDATGAVAVLQGVPTHFTQLVTDWTADANMDLLETEIARRDTAPVGLGGILYVGVSGTKGTMLTWADDRNARLVCAVGVGKMPNAPWEAAAMVAGARAGVADVDVSSLGTPMPGIRPPTLTSQWLDAIDRNELLGAGISTLRVGADGNVYIERLVTTKTLDGAGNPFAEDRNVMDQEVNAVIRLTIAAKGYNAILGKKFVADDAPETDGRVSALTLRAFIQGVITGDLGKYAFDPKASAATVVVETVPGNINARKVKFSFARIKEAFGLFNDVEVN
jgi:phage tail sheath gpL-like